MPSIYTTTRGKQIDMQRLILKNENAIAVGNAGTNARGDLVQGGKIVKTREQLMQEEYNISGNNIVKDQRVRHSAADVEPDNIPDRVPVEMTSPYESLSATPTAVEVVNQAPLTEEPRGGLASAVSRSQELAEKLAAQRRRI